MNAGELIHFLEQLHPETKIVVRGYEDGYNDIRELRTVKIKLQPEAPWYYGEYADNHDPDALDAVELFGENRNENE